MPAKVTALLESLQKFIAQPDYPTLVLNGSDRSMLFPTRILTSLDRQEDDIYYLVYPEPCVTAAAYMDSIAKSMVLAHEVLAGEFAARRLSLPPLPLAVQDGRYSPAQRLRAAVDYWGEQLPKSQIIVWGLLPNELKDTPGYQSMIEPLLAPVAVEPWMERHRFVVRDQRAQPLIVPALLKARNGRVLVQEVDSDDKRFREDLIETAYDKAQPADDRVFAMFLLGAIDFAYRRLAEALEKYGVCFNYYQGKGNHVMQALCLKGAGDAAALGGKPVEALKFFQQSIAVSLEAKDSATLQQGVYSAGCTSMDLGEFPDAEAYFKQANELAGRNNNPHSKCDALEKLGQARWRLSKVEEACEAWESGKNLSIQFGYYERAHSTLDHLIAVYRAGGQSSRVAVYEREKAALPPSVMGHAHG